MLKVCIDLFLHIGNAGMDHIKNVTEARCHLYPPKVSDKAPTVFRIYFTFK